ncbi:Sperm-associated antigen 6 [Coelomomyces lativittatus]|nr:Sperm-associated antigen 6 [Coelomomyces lativittatus]
MPTSSTSSTHLSPTSGNAVNFTLDKSSLASPPTSSSTKQIAQVMETYQKARLQFAQCIAESAARESNMEYLALPETRSLIIPLLRPLLLDKVVSVQQAAAVALGRLANHSPEMALELVSGEVLPHIVYTLDSSNARFITYFILFFLKKIYQKTFTVIPST